MLADDVPVFGCALASPKSPIFTQLCDLKNTFSGYMKPPKKKDDRNDEYLP